VSRIFDAFQTVIIISTTYHGYKIILSAVQVLTFNPMLEMHTLRNVEYGCLSHDLVTYVSTFTYLGSHILDFFSLCGTYHSIQRQQQNML